MPRFWWILLGCWALSQVVLGLPCCKCANWIGSEYVNCCGSLDISGSGCTCNGDTCMPCTPEGEECTSTHTTAEEKYEICAGYPAGCCTVTGLVGNDACCIMEGIAICLSKEDTLINPYVFTCTLNSIGQLALSLGPTDNETVFGTYYNLNLPGATSAAWLSLTVPPPPPAPPVPVPAPCPAPVPKPCPGPSPENKMPPVWLLALVGVLGAIALGSTIGLVVTCCRQRKAGYSPLVQ